jgi:GxxExxY protein
MLNAEAQRRNDAEKLENVLSEQIINAAIEVHRTLGGPGLLESLYEEALYYELQLRHIPVESQVSVPVSYKKRILKDPMRMDLLVDRKVIIEVKAVDQLHPVHKAQLLTYLRLTGLKLGVVLNFGQGRLVEGIARVANSL